MLQAAVLDPFLVMITTLEATQKPTSNLVKPFVGKMIDRLDAERSTVTTYRGVKEVIKVCALLAYSTM